MNGQTKLQFPATYKERRCIRCGHTFYGFAWQFNCTPCKSEIEPSPHMKGRAADIAFKGYKINDKLKEYLKKLKNS